jgi:hypothetical protein
MKETLTNITVLILLLFIFLGFGKRLLRLARIEGETVPEGFGLSLAAGLAAASLLVFVLAAARLISPASIILLLAAMLLFSIREIVETATSRIRSRKALGDKAPGLNSGSAPAGAKTIITLLVLSATVMSLAPPTGTDALSIHLVTPKRMLQESGLAATGEYHFHRPGAFYFIYLVAMAIKGDVVAKLLNLSTSFSALALVYSTSERLRKGTGFLAAFIMSSTPIMVGYMGYENLEIPSMMFVTVSLYSMVRYRQGGGCQWLTASVSAAGFAAGMKVSGFSAFTLGLWFALEAFLTRGWKPSWKPILTGIAVAGVAVGYWPIWNQLTIGRALPAYADPGNTSGIVLPGGSVSTALFQIAFATLTLSLHWTDSLGPWIIVALVGAVFFRGRSGGLWLTGLFASCLLFYLTVVGILAPHFLKTGVHSHVRYQSLCLIPLGSLLAATFAGWASSFQGWARRLTGLAIILPAIAFLSLKAIKATVCLPVVVGLESQDTYISKKIETYRACREVNGMHREGSRIFAALYWPYHLDHPYDSFFSPEYTGTNSLTEWISRMRHRGVTHVLVEPIYALPPGIPTARELGHCPDFREIARWPHWCGHPIALYRISSP